MPNPKTNQELLPSNSNEANLADEDIDLIMSGGKGKKMNVDLATKRKSRIGKKKIHKSSRKTPRSSQRRLREEEDDNSTGSEYSQEYTSDDESIVSETFEDALVEEIIKIKDEASAAWSFLETTLVSFLDDDDNSEANGSNSETEDEASSTASEILDDLIDDGALYLQDSALAAYQKVEKAKLDAKKWTEDRYSDITFSSGLAMDMMKLRKQVSKNDDDNSYIVFLGDPSQSGFDEISVSDQPSDHSKTEKVEGEMVQELDKDIESHKSNADDGNYGKCSDNEIHDAIGDIGNNNNTDDRENLNERLGNKIQEEQKDKAQKSSEYKENVVIEEAKSEKIKEPLGISDSDRIYTLSFILEDLAKEADERHPIFVERNVRPTIIEDWFEGTTERQSLPTEFFKMVMNSVPALPANAFLSRQPIELLDNDSGGTSMAFLPTNFFLRKQAEELSKKGPLNDSIFILPKNIDMTEHDDDDDDGHVGGWDEDFSPREDAPGRKLPSLNSDDIHDCAVEKASNLSIDRKDSLERHHMQGARFEVEKRLSSIVDNRDDTLKTLMDLAEEEERRDNWQHEKRDINSSWASHNGSKDELDHSRTRKAMLPKMQAPDQAANLPSKGALDAQTPNDEYKKRNGKQSLMKKMFRSKKDDQKNTRPTSE